VSLVARQLESAGIATVIIGSALDIVEYCGVPRYLFTDFPLGNPCGRPYDTEEQRDIMSRALGLFEAAEKPGQTVATSLVWDKSATWKERYMHVGPDNIDALRAAGDLRRRQQEAAKDGAQKSAG
jgi:D-proline reductase (dithiol) PrdB